MGHGRRCYADMNYLGNCCFARKLTADVVCYVVNKTEIFALGV